MSVAVLEGYLEHKVSDSGWKKRFFVLDVSGELRYSEKKGAAVKGQYKITSNSNVSVLKELGEEGGISITGPGHEPIYLKADSPEVAEGWIQALRLKQKGKKEKKQGDDLRAAFANKNILGDSGRGLKNSTLERKGKAKGSGAETKKEKRKSDKSKRKSKEKEKKDAPPPPSLEDVTTMDEKEQEEEEQQRAEERADIDFEDGYIMRLGKKDVFVDSNKWNYFDSREDFLAGKKPKGKALLSLLV